MVAGSAASEKTSPRARYRKEPPASLAALLKTRALLAIVFIDQNYYTATPSLETPAGFTARCRFRQEFLFRNKGPRNDEDADARMRNITQRHRLYVNDAERLLRSIAVRGYAPGSAKHAFTSRELPAGIGCGGRWTLKDLSYIIC
jgi:hypothetical protein